MKKHIAVAALALCSVAAFTQTTTTNCYTYGGNTNCTSTTQVPATQTPAYLLGQQLGQALGNGLNAYASAPPTVNWRRLHKYCKKHTNSSYRWTAQGQVLATGYCNADGSYTVN
jgi:hypothetical protein